MEILLGWLITFNFICQGLNGILADEMGLGKTIQAMAFLAHLAEVSDLVVHVLFINCLVVNYHIKNLSG